jgi:hypothetical protein
MVENIGYGRVDVGWQGGVVEDFDLADAMEAVAE